MRLVFTERFDRSLRETPGAIQRAFWKQSRFLLQNLHHPSLRAKKFDAANDVWQARVNRSWRFYFKIIRDEYHLIDITPHGLIGSRSAQSHRAKSHRSCDAGGDLH